MQDVVKDLIIKNEKKIVLLVMDGLGGLPREKGGKTELETADTPNFDALAAGGECGLHLPIGFGITPGSAPGHLALFGYQPTDYPIGRGVVAALGIGFPIKPRDVAARVNFASGFAFIGVLVGLILLIWGDEALRRLWFPLSHRR